VKIYKKSDKVEEEEGEEEKTKHPVELEIFFITWLTICFHWLLEFS
jgi:hypothetical protein